jgi:hypothetical protein
MPGKLYEQHRLSPKLLQRLADRDVALWIGRGFPENDESAEAIAKIAAFPWRVVLLESSAARVAGHIERIANNDAPMIRRRGFAHSVYSDPTDLQLPPQSLPIFFLNGRQGGVGPDDSELATRAANRRRLNQIARMVASRPTEVVLLSFGNADPLEEFQAVWSEDLRSLVSIVATHETDKKRTSEWLAGIRSPPAIDYYSLDVEQLRLELQDFFDSSRSAGRTVVRFRDPQGALIDRDITSCELPDHPLLDRYELVAAEDVGLLQPSELSFEEFCAFFDRSGTSWRPYAAGVPWIPDKSSVDEVIRSLETVAASGADENRMHLIAAEPGAGGTTLARAIAHRAAVAGYPALVARPVPFTPSVTEVESFLLRVGRSYDAAKGTETPWLVVFDAAHWAGKEAELRHFTSHLIRRGRPVVVLAVTSEQLDERLLNTLRAEPIAVLSHQMDRDDAVALGAHLNRFLAPRGRTKSPGEWTTFWEAHRPGLDTPIASFWIALEFWLKGFLDLGQSIQEWIYSQFQKLQDADLRTMILEIAALTVERHPFPEELMPAAGGFSLPYSVQLDDARSEAPGLGLVREMAGTQRRWALAHTQLGRYLLNSVFFDRRINEQLGFGVAKNATHLRLLLLRRIVGRAELAREEFKQLALDFAVRIFKLDSGYAAEYFPMWRDVFETLNGVVTTVRNTSRTFLHHIAISCRRVATNSAFFETNQEDRELLLRSAIKHIEFALSLPRTEDEESDLNLYNSLARAYQNLADVRRAGGAQPPELEHLRKSATDATLRAQREDPLNPYVLETTAENLLQSAALAEGEQRITDSVMALNFINEALVRDRAASRATHLNRLLMKAIGLLRKTDTKAALAKLQANKQSVGFVAQAWLELTDNAEDSEAPVFAIGPDRAGRALTILNQAEGQDWLLLKLRYDLLAVVHPTTFDEQLAILEALGGTAFQMPLQYHVEHAILLHQVGRHAEAAKRYRGLRRLLRERDEYVEVPLRMRWLLRRGGHERQVCDARVFDASGFRHFARVRDLADDRVPFTPQDFGQRQFTVGQPLKVTINFGAMGPFAKPATAPQ